MFLEWIYPYAMQYAFRVQYAICIGKNAINMQYAKVCILHILLYASSASSAGIERIFSIASGVQERRFRLSAQATENELMIKVNRQFLFNYKC